MSQLFHILLFCHSNDLRVNIDVSITTGHPWVRGDGVRGHGWHNHRICFHFIKKKNPKQQNKQKFPGSHNPRVKFFIVHTSFDRTSEHSCTYLHENSYV